MRKRLDQLLVEKKMAPTRSRARDAILRGLVQVAGATIEKPGQLIEEENDIVVSGGSGLDYVSRGAVKLSAALDRFGFCPKDRVVADIGASTGGFTDVLLRRGAHKVFAVDVGHSQLDERLRVDPRVIALEQLDARDVTAEHITDPLAAVVADLSFISLTKALPAVLHLTEPGAWLVALVKPQFEVGRSAIGKGGIVRDHEMQHHAVRAFCDWLTQQTGWSPTQTMTSPIKGGSGNTEFLVGASRDT